MQRHAIKRLPAAHLALVGVCLAGVVAMTWSFVEHRPATSLPAIFARAVTVEAAAAAVYLLAVGLFASLRLARVPGTAALAQRLLKPTVAVEAMLVLACTSVLIRGYSSRGLLAGLDVLLPTVIVVAVMSIAVTMATRHEAADDLLPEWPRGAWLWATSLVRIAACLVLLGALGFLEGQSLPNSLVH
ncbi:MAG: hypothetical protein KF708_00945 [Pirellulales bacterium]|nr:hypothetical protein [Pirellulales bacterium]